MDPVSQAAEGYVTAQQLAREVAEEEERKRKQKELLNTITKWAAVGGIVVLGILWIASGD